MTILDLNVFVINNSINNKNKHACILTYHICMYIHTLEKYNYDRQVIKQHKEIVRGEKETENNWKLVKLQIVSSPLLFSISLNINI